MKSIIQEQIIPSSFKEKILFFYLDSDPSSLNPDHQRGAFSHIRALEKLTAYIPPKPNILVLSDDPSNSVIFYDKIMEARCIFVKTENSSPLLKKNITINAIKSVCQIIDSPNLSNIGDEVYMNQQLDLIRINQNNAPLETLRGLEKTIQLNKPTISIRIRPDLQTEIGTFAQEEDYNIIIADEDDNYLEIILQSTKAADCPGNLFIDQNNKTICYENMPTTVEELAIIFWLKDHQELVKGKNVLHVGTGNGQLISTLTEADHIDTITISGAEKIKIDAMVFPNVQAHLINKHNSIECNRLENNYDIIIDVNLKSFSCCEEHYNTYVDFLFSRLRKSGIIISAMSGVNFGWNGNFDRAYTPGSKKVEEEMNFRVLGDQGLEQMKNAYHLNIKKITIEDIHHHHGLLSEDGPPIISSEEIVILQRATQNI